MLSRKQQFHWRAHAAAVSGLNHITSSNLSLTLLIPIGFH